MEIMSYHADSDPKGAEELAKLSVPSALSLNIQSLHFSNLHLEVRLENWADSHLLEIFFAKIKIVYAYSRLGYVK